MEDQIKTEDLQETYQPRPKWQVWGARVCLVVFILVLLMYYMNLMRGGL